MSNKQNPIAQWPDGPERQERPEVRAGRPRDKATHDAILRAARKLLRDAGYAGFSIEEVAGLAGVAKTSIYRRWPSKGDLLVDLYMDAVDASPLTARHETVGEDFGKFLEQTVDRLQIDEWRNILRSLVAEAQNNPRTADLVRGKIVDSRRTAGKALLTIGKARGEIRPDIDDDILLDFVFGAIWYRLLLGHAPLDRAFAKRLLRSMLEFARPETANSR